MLAFRRFADMAHWRLTVNAPHLDLVVQNESATHFGTYFGTGRPYSGDYGRYCPNTIISSLRYQQ
jgi:hypothetical protein